VDYVRDLDAGERLDGCFHSRTDCGHGVPIVNVAIIVANFAVWLFYELPHLRHAVFVASFYPCTVDNSCQGPEWAYPTRWISGALP